MFDWDSYLPLARRLSTSTDEAELRTAISRAYYCVYHRATATCTDQQLLRPNRHRIREQLQEASASIGQTELATLGERGEDLKLLRQRADYHNPFTRDNKNLRLADKAMDAVSQAEELLELLDNL